MEKERQFQIRVDVADEHAPSLRQSIEDAALGPLREVLGRHDAKAVCQYDAFAGYCAEAEREGIEEDPL